MRKDDQNWNPRYVYYAKIHGRSPEKQFELDRETYPSDYMVGFMRWMADKKAEFYKIRPEAFFDRNRISDHSAWEYFLRNSVK